MKLLIFENKVPQTVEEIASIIINIENGKYVIEKDRYCKMKTNGLRIIEDFMNEKNITITEGSVQKGGVNNPPERKRPLPLRGYLDKQTMNKEITYKDITEILISLGSAGWSDQAKILLNRKTSNPVDFSNAIEKVKYVLSSSDWEIIQESLISGYLENFSDVVKVEEDKKEEDYKFKINSPEYEKER